MMAMSSAHAACCITVLVLLCGHIPPSSACQDGFSENPSGCYMTVSVSSSQAAATSHCEALDPPAKLIDLETKQEFDDVLDWLHAGMTNTFTANTRRSLNVVLMSARRLRCRPNIKTILALVFCSVAVHCY